jgi:hypothetical protein
MAMTRQTALVPITIARTQTFDQVDALHIRGGPHG